MKYIAITLAIAALTLVGGGGSAIWAQQSGTITVPPGAATFSWVFATATPTPTPSPTPTPTSNCTSTTVAGVTITDNSGNLWTFNAAGQVVENGTPFTNTSGAVTITLYNGSIYQENTAGNWYKYLGPSQYNWIGASAPVCGTATPTPTPPSPTPTVTPTVTPSVTPSNSPTPTPSSSPTVTPTPVAGAAMRVNDFDNTLGANTRMVQGNDSVAQLTTALPYLGIRHIREEATHANTGNYPGGNFAAIHSATGVSIDMVAIVDDGTVPSSSCVVSTSNPYCGSMADEIYAMNYLKSIGALAQIEGPNEPNNEPFTYVTSSGSLACNGSTWQGCGQYMADLYVNLASLAPIANLTEGGAEVNNVGIQFLTIPSGTTGTEFPAGTSFSNIANQHNYFVGTSNPPYGDNQAWFAEAPTDSECTPKTCFDGPVGNNLGTTWGHGYAGYPIGTVLPLITTETGAETGSSPNETQDQQGKALVDVYLSAAARGWQKTYMYTLFDQTSDGTTYGFYASDHATLKLSGTYMHNLTSVLSDTTSAFTPGTVNYSISPLPATVHSLLMQKSNGTFELVIWDDRPVGEATDNVTVNLGGSYATVNVYDITSGTTPVNTYSNVGSVALALTDHAMIVEF